MEILSYIVGEAWKHATNWFSISAYMGSTTASANFIPGHTTLDLSSEPQSPQCPLLTQEHLPLATTSTKFWSFAGPRSIAFPSSFLRFCNLSLLFFLIVLSLLDAFLDLNVTKNVYLEVVISYSNNLERTWKQFKIHNSIKTALVAVSQNSEACLNRSMRRQSELRRACRCAVSQNSEVCLNHLMHNFAYFQDSSKATDHFISNQNRSFLKKKNQNRSIPVCYIKFKIYYISNY